MITEQDVRDAITSSRENFDASRLPLTEDFGDAGLDSLDHASVLLELQEKFGIEFPESVDSLNTIKAILDYAQANG